MPLPGLKVLIFAQIALDLTIVLVFVYLLWKLRHFNKGTSFDKTLKLFESLLAEADKTAVAFKGQLEEKQHLVKRLNDELDNRITRLNVLLNRADVLLSSRSNQGIHESEFSVSLNSQPTKILEMSEDGHTAEEIATTLSIPKEEVNLVLDLKRKNLPK
jgi:hypothetical protein